MERSKAEQTLSDLRTYENACAAGMEREWCEAKYIAEMAEWDDRAGITTCRPGGKST